MPKISALPPAGTLADDDETPFVDDDVATTKKFTLAGLLVWLQSKVGWIVTAMLADGAVTNIKALFTAGSDASGSITLGSGVTTTDLSLYKVNNIVYLTGFLNKTSFGTGDTVLTLPAGYRPVAGIWRAAAFSSGGDASRVEVPSTGVLVMRIASGSRTTCVFSLTFPAS